MTKTKFSLLGVILLALFLRIYKLKDYLSFIGDQGWFYVSAKEIAQGSIPLIGITASHTWLYQGPLWSYMLFPVLKISNYDPIWGAYLSVFLGILTVIAIYFVGRDMLGITKTGIVSALIFATSPLVILHSRLPYHTSPLSLFTLLFIYSLYKYSKGNKNYLILTAFSLGLLYQLQLSTMVFWVLAGIIIFLVKKFDIRLFFLSAVSFIIAIFPFIIYDFKEGYGFYQSTAFLRLIKVSIFDSSGFNPNVYLDLINNLLLYNQKLLFAGSITGASVLLLFSILFLAIRIISEKRKNYGLIILSFWLILSIAGIMMNKTPTEAYLPMIYPGIILMVGFMFATIINKYKDFRLFVYLILVIIVFLNIRTIITSNYFTKNFDFISYQERLNASEKIVEITKNKKYNLIQVGTGSEFPNNLKNYEYLTWWFGNPPSDEEQKVKIILEEKEGKIIINAKN